MAIYMWREWPDYLCFTANTAGSTVRLWKTGSPTVVSLETSTDGANWSSYTIWDTITLSNIGDSIYMRNTSETTTGFSNNTSNYYYFVLSWDINASWDVTSLINKNLTNTLTNNYCFYYLFRKSSSDTVLKTTPNLSATTLTTYCYFWMFINCAWLTIIPKLPALTLAWNCYNSMFQWCSNIKLSQTQTWEYQTPYRIPTEWAGTTATNAMTNMFYNTWWTFTWTPTINTTYYTSNTVI